MSARSAGIAAAATAVVSGLIWVGLIELVSSSCGYDCTDKGERYAYLAVVVVVGLLLPAVALIATLEAAARPAWLPRILLGTSVLLSTACVLVAVGLTIIVISGEADLLVALVAALLWVGAGLASLAVRRLNAITGS